MMTSIPPTYSLHIELLRLLRAKRSRFHLRFFKSHLHERCLRGGECAGTRRSTPELAIFLSGLLYLRDGVEHWTKYPLRGYRYSTRIISKNNNANTRRQLTFTVIEIFMVFGVIEDARFVPLKATRSRGAAQ